MEANLEKFKSSKWLYNDLRTTQLPQTLQNSTSVDQGKLLFFKPLLQVEFWAIFERFSYILLNGSKRNAILSRTNNVWVACGETLKFVFVKYQTILVKSYQRFTAYTAYTCLCVTKCLTIFWSILSSNNPLNLPHVSSCQMLHM